MAWAVSVRGSGGGRTTRSGEAPGALRNGENGERIDRLTVLPDLKMKVWSCGRACIAAECYDLVAGNLIVGCNVQLHGVPVDRFVPFGMPDPHKLPIDVVL